MTRSSSDSKGSMQDRKGTKHRITRTGEVEGKRKRKDKGEIEHRK